MSGPDEHGCYVVRFNDGGNVQLKLQFAPTPENGPRHAAIAVNAARKVSRVELDYSVQSLKELDRVLDGFHRDRADVEAIAETLFTFGCYVGEVFVRNAQGRWVDVEETPMKNMEQFPIVIELPGGSLCNPIGRVFKRVENGLEDSLPYFYEVFGKNSNSAAPRKPWWKIW
jgi:hypothetical protein